MKNPLWTRNFSLLIAATTFGCMGGIVGNFALSFLVLMKLEAPLHLLL